MPGARLFLALTAWSLVPGVSAAETAVSLRVPELAGADRDEIVTSGVPLGKGALTDESQARLLDAAGQEVPFVGTVLARWRCRRTRSGACATPAFTPASAAGPRKARSAPTSPRATMKRS